MSRLLDALKEIESDLPVRDDAAMDRTLAQAETAAGSIDSVKAADSPRVSQPTLATWSVPAIEIEPPTVPRRVVGSLRAPQPPEGARNAPAADVEPSQSPCAAAAPRVDPYTELARNIAAQFPLGKPLSLALASTDDMEGMTGLLIRLGTALAEQTNGGVLLVDANVRRPELARCLGMEVADGLGAVLTGTTDWSQAVRPTGVRRLSILPTKRLSDPHARLLPENLGELLRQWKQHYRVVLLDAGSAMHEEVCRLAGFCDGVYLIVEFDHTRRRAMAKAARLLRRHYGRLLGCVVIAGG